MSDDILLTRESDAIELTVVQTGGGGGGSGTVTSVSGTAPIAVATGTTTPVVSISAASGAAAGSMSSTDFTKLAGIESAATADQSAAEILAKLITVDGVGSGLDADLLDGNSSAAFQPVDSDLTAIAALTTTAYGRAFLALDDASAGRTALGLGTAALSASGDFQPVDSDLTSIAALTTTAFGRGLLALADAAALRTSAGLTAFASLATGTSAQYVRGDGVLATTGTAGQLIAVNAYDPGTTTSYTTTSATVADVDATNMAVTFTAPASGNVLVTLTARTASTLSSAVFHWGLREATTNLALSSFSANIAYQPRTAKFYITGLTPASSHTYKWSFSSDGAATHTVTAGGTAGAEGQAIIEIWAAP